MGRLMETVKRMIDDAYRHYAHGNESNGRHAMTRSFATT